MSYKNDDSTTYFMLSESERKERAKLTPKEKAAVDALVAAVKSLPRTLCIDVDDDEFTIQKYITSGSALQVGKVTKKGLRF